MNYIRNIVFILALALAIPLTSSAQTIPDYVIVGLKTGNAQQLAQNFSDNVELVILDDDNVYSKAHAQQVIADFFKKYPPKDFSIIYQGGKEESSYAIGNLQVQNEKFRVYFLVKTKNGSSQIHQLRIERQTK